MYLLHNIGERKNSNYNTREEILNSKGLLSFDGIYTNVWENRDILRGRELILFVMGNYVGKDNRFDVGMPRELYLDWDKIYALSEELDAPIGWHTWSHRDLRSLSDKDLIMEVTPPFPMDYFAYPAGLYDERVIEAVKAAGFKKAWSVTQGDDLTPFTLKRKYLNW
jgi:hypothetical protein